MHLPDDCRYSEEHEWVRLDGDIAVVGITDFAQEQLGDIVFVELPSVGTNTAFMGIFGTVEAVKTVSDLYAPMSGTVVEVNTGLESRPEAVNQDPYGDGWMIKVRLTGPDEYEKLMTADAYRAHIGV
ncbi:MAG: glycine cleavage system protein GcvH [candidate division Zixibacteria bacterium]|nr:glycine cleavage system protein GcvH [candidate division Zixibacteria bacterium]